MDDVGHEAQHAARALEARQRGPVVVEAVEELGVDRVGVHHAALVGALAALGRELRLVLRVEGAKDLGDGLALAGRLRLERLEEATADDLEALLGGGRLPG